MEPAGQCRSRTGCQRDRRPLPASLGEQHRVDARQDAVRDAAIASCQGQPVPRRAARRREGRRSDRPHGGGERHHVAGVRRFRKHSRGRSRAAASSSRTICSSAAAATATCTGTQSASSGPDFIASNGDDLTLGGEAYKFTGLNEYTMGGHCAYATDLTRDLKDWGPGKRVLRTWFFQSSTGTGARRDWARFDAVLAAAERKRHQGHPRAAE